MQGDGRGGERGREKGERKEGRGGKEEAGREKSGREGGECHPLYPPAPPPNCTQSGQNTIGFWPL